MPKKPKPKQKPPVKSNLDILIAQLSAKHESDPHFASPVGLSNILLIKQIKLLEEIKDGLCRMNRGQI